jgi:ribulose 1,5-bisphosphate carboxylase large subunit-like protein
MNKMQQALQHSLNSNQTRLNEHLNQQVSTLEQGTAKLQEHLNAVSQETVKQAVDLSNRMQVMSSCIDQLVAWQKENKSLLDSSNNSFHEAVRKIQDIFNHQSQYEEQIKNHQEVLANITNTFEQIQKTTKNLKDLHDEVYMRLVILEQGLGSLDRLNETLNKLVQKY